MLICVSVVPQSFTEAPSYTYAMKRLSLVRRNAKFPFPIALSYFSTIECTEPVAVRYIHADTVHAEVGSVEVASGTRTPEVPPKERQFPSLQVEVTREGVPL